MQGKTNFAYMEEATNTALLHEARSPTLPKSSVEQSKQKGLQLIAGLEVLDESVVQKSIAGSLSARKTKAKAFFADRDEVTAKLKKLGIVPLAVVPKAPWEQICDNAGLYRLNPGKDNTVNVGGGELLDRIQERTRFILNAALALVIASAAIPAGWGMWSSMFYPAAHDIAMLVLGGILSLASADIAGFLTAMVVVGVCGGFTKSPWIENALNEVQFTILNFTPKSKLLQAYFPNGIEPSFSTLKAHLVLPLPPADVAATLLKAKSLALKVAAVGEAIGFAEKPSQILRSEQRRRIEEKRAQEERARLERLRTDPIVYHEHKSAVAIIAQFGDFPVEKEAVDKAIFAEFLL